MRILCCHVPGQLRDETRAAVDKHAAKRCKVIYVELDPEDPYAYGRVLAEEWQLGLGFSICEPDVVWRKDVVDAFLTCPVGYCAFPYDLGTDCMPALGATFFSEHFLRRYPNAMRDTLTQRPTFRQLDVVLQRAVLVRQHGEQPHVHLPKVEHLNPDKSPLWTGSNPEPVTRLPAW